MSARVVVAIRVDATLERTFDAFVGEIGAWWQPHPLFLFDHRRQGTLAFEPGPDGSFAGGRLVERYGDGEALIIGEIHAWEPPRRLAFSWRHASFGPDQSTDVDVRFQSVSGQTRVTVEHAGWDTIPLRHAARHGIELMVFQRRLGDWWRALLGSLAATARPGEPDPRA